MARPRIQLSPDQVEAIESLSGMGASLEEVATSIGISVDTLTLRFTEAIKKGRLKGRVSMKRKLFEMAMAGNLGARIWWGKNYMEESDKIESKNETAGTLVVQSVEERKERLQKALLNLKALDDK